MRECFRVASDDDFHLLSLASNGTLMMDVRGDGLTTIRSGGLKVMSGGTTVVGGLKVRLVWEVSR
jgi:hypothetical protein